MGLKVEVRYRKAIGKKSQKDVDVECLDNAIKKWKKALDKSGLMKDLRRHEFYEKPSEKRNRRKARERAILLLEKVGLGERKEHLPFQLSAGEQQRVAIARSLANDPPLILADEPTANLDKQTSLYIRDLFKDMKDDDKTIIIATHDNYLIELATRIITFEDAEIVKEENITN